MKVRVFFNVGWLDWLKIDGITLYPYVFIRFDKQNAIDKCVLQHEFIHVAQVRQKGVFWFYLDYLYQWLAGVPYESISYEKEAYSLQFAVTPPIIDIWGLEVDGASETKV